MFWSLQLKDVKNFTIKIVTQFKAISNVSLYECVNNIKFSSKEALVSFMDGKKLEDSIITINNLTVFNNFNIKESKGKLQITF